MRTWIIAALALVALAVARTNGQTVFTVGADEGEGMLLYPRQVEEGPDGNIYVFDAADSFVKIYTPAGEYLRSIGGEGEGPGEFLRADGAGFGFLPDGGLFFTEFIGGHRWITLMESSGNLRGVLSIELEEAFGISRAYALKDGGYLVQLTLFSTPQKTSDYYLYSDPQSLVLIDSNGRIASEIISTEYITMISMIPDGATSGLPYYPIFEWVPLGDGTVVFADGMSSTLKVLDYSGKPVREIVSDLPGPQKVTKEDLDAWRKKREERMMARNPSWYSQFGKVIYKYEKSLYDKPMISRLSATPGGRLLVAGVWNPEENARTYWLIESDGKTAAEVALDCGSLSISRSYVFYTTTDEDENIVVNCSRRSGDERSDLLAIRSP